MITIDALRVYQRYEGDIDGFSRRKDPREMLAITDEDWRNISLLLQRLALEKNVPVAESFRAETSRLLAEQVVDEATVRLLREIAI